MCFVLSEGSCTQKHILYDSHSVTLRKRHNFGFRKQIHSCQKQVNEERGLATKNHRELLGVTELLLILVFDGGYITVSVGQNL